MFDLHIITQPHSEVYCGYFRRLVFGNSLMLAHIPPCFHANPPDFPRLIVPREIEAILQRLLPGTLTQAPQPRPATAHRDWAVVVCFSCGNYGHEVSRCRKLNIKCPYMLPGWSAEKRGDHYAMISPRLTAEPLRCLH